MDPKNDRWKRPWAADPAVSRHVGWREKGDFTTGKQALNGLVIFFKEVGGRPEVDPGGGVVPPPALLPAILRLHIRS